MFVHPFMSIGPRPNHAGLWLLWRMRESLPRPTGRGKLFGSLWPPIESSNHKTNLQFQFVYVYFIAVCCFCLRLLLWGFGPRPILCSDGQLRFFWRCGSSLRTLSTTCQFLGLQKSHDMFVEEHGTAMILVHCFHNLHLACSLNFQQSQTSRLRVEAVFFVHFMLLWSCTSHFLILFELSPTAHTGYGDRWQQWLKIKSSAPWLQSFAQQEWSFCFPRISFWCLPYFCMDYSAM